MRKLTIGLTGGLASGKSTVAGWLTEAGFHVVDADKLVAELYQPGCAGVAVVRAQLGPEFVDESGAVDRAKVAGRVFANPKDLRALECAVHPLVRKRFEELVAGAEGVMVLEATLLIEAGYAPGFDLIVTVEADAETRLKRAIARGLDEQGARARILAQGDGNLRRKGAHRVIDNSGDLSHLRRQTDELIVELERLCNPRAPQPPPRAGAPD
jgi:dephospho-CoA kinase